MRGLLVMKKDIDNKHGFVCCSYPINPKFVIEKGNSSFLVFSVWMCKNCKKERKAFVGPIKREEAYLVLNPNVKVRNEILGIEDGKDLEQFKDLDVNRLACLLNMGFMDNTSYFNHSPTVQKVYDFMLKHRGKIFANGYAHDFKENSSDSGMIYIEEIYGKNLTDDENKDFIKFVQFGASAEVVYEGEIVKAWWD